MNYDNSFSDLYNKFLINNIITVIRDLKPENVLISKDGCIKLTDFGLSKRISKDTRTMCGTPQYIAPEIILLKVHGKSVDWWSLEIVMFEMVTGNLPFYDDNQRNLFKKIVAGSYKTYNNCSDDFLSLTKNSLQTDSKKDTETYQMELLTLNYTGKKCVNLKHTLKVFMK